MEWHHHIKNLQIVPGCFTLDEMTKVMVVGPCSSTPEALTDDVRYDTLFSSVMKMSFSSHQYSAKAVPVSLVGSCLCFAQH
jgi:hypothetical protein